MTEHITIEITPAVEESPWPAVKRQVIIYMLDKTAGNVSQAAALLGMSQPALKKAMSRLGLNSCLTAIRQDKYPICKPRGPGHGLHYQDIIRLCTTSQ
jgi:hypothetical protein